MSTTEALLLSPYGALENSAYFMKSFMITSYDIRLQSEIIGSPVEMGQKVFDNKVVQPVIVSINGLILSENNNADSIYEDFVKAWEERSWDNFWRFYDKMDRVYENLMLRSCPIRGEPDKYDAIPVSLEFIQIMITSQSAPKSLNPSDSNTQNSGLKGGK